MARRKQEAAMDVDGVSENALKHKPVSMAIPGCSVDSIITGPSDL